MKTIGNRAFENSGLTSINIPNNITSLGEQAFSQCPNLVSVTFEENINFPTLGTSAFSSCTSLNSIKIPDSVTSISDYAFYNCTQLSDLEFEGTVEQWNAITFGDDWDYDIPATTVKCSNGTVNI